ncbi:hypothetical protein PYCCODRAFT_1448877 [Trametes coccinea BRFM310]|uniref:FUN14-domain-containing protein n=1 Tax=Trametes coccinea (strain BRFM310) TaxID=1353009 RepID=A0A1Y2J5U8_TRAC3|nr:hypothetical protein PYCCODRAFT_1448877 [Trametes coccinea BRFM310]
MPPFPLPSLVSRQLCNAFPKVRPVNSRFFIPKSTYGAARYQHMEMAKRTEIGKEIKEEFRWSMLTVFFKYGAVSVGLGLSVLAAPMIYCDPVTSKPAPATVLPPTQGTAAPVQPPPPPPPSSSVNFYELTFGTVCGVCAGVFVKKGAKAVAFVMGGVFVLLQYLGSLSLLRVDWSRAATRFENLFYTTDATGAKRPPNVGSLFRWIIDFLTADFQQRASFVAGFTLGLRIG